MFGLLEAQSAGVTEQDQERPARAADGWGFGVSELLYHVPALVAGLTFSAVIVSAAHELGYFVVVSFALISLLSPVDFLKSSFFGYLL
jgi:hypothetical protein